MRNDVGFRTRALDDVGKNETPAGAVGDAPVKIRFAGGGTRADTTKSKCPAGRGSSSRPRTTLQVGGGFLWATHRGLPILVRCAWSVVEMGRARSRPFSSQMVFGWVSK